MKSTVFLIQLAAGSCFVPNLLNFLILTSTTALNIHLLLETLLLQSTSHLIRLRLIGIAGNWLAVNTWHPYEIMLQLS